MKRILTLSLQTLIILFAILVLFLMIRMPQTEGRAVNLDLFSIYSDPFIIYIYLSSIAFFVALYQGFKLLGFIRLNEWISQKTVRALKRIKYCAILLFFAILLAGLYIILFHHKDDDPAGFIAICMFLDLIALGIAFIAGILERKVQRQLN